MIIKPKSIIKKIILRVFNYNLIEYKPYNAPLDILIKRSLSRMIVKPICPFCNRFMKFRFSRISGGGINLPIGSPIRDDIGFKCIHCFHTCHFGIPITRKLALEEIKLRNGNFINRPSKRTDETYKKEVRERLKALGYIDF